MPRSRKKKRKPAAISPAARAAVANGLFDTGEGRRANDRRNLAIVVGLALVIRVIFFLLHRENDPLFYHPIMDASFHHEWALNILAGDFWGDAVFFRAPLYPYLLALVYKLSGSSIAVAIFIQHLIGSASTAMTYVLARQFFVARVSLVAGLLAALYWPFVYFEGDLLIVTLIILLDLVLLLLLVKSLRRGGLAVTVASGVLLGLSAIARPSILVLVPVVPAIFFLRDRQPRDRSPGPTPRWLRQTLLVYAGALAIIAPVLVRNYIVGRDIVPIASQGGVNFYIGNNPQSDGRTAIVPGTRWDWWGGYEDAIRLAETDMGRSLRPSEISNYYFRRGFAFIFGSPGQSIPLLARKAGLFWAGGERANNKFIYFFWHKSGMGKVPLPGFWLVGPLGLAGMVLLWRRRRDLWLLYLFVATYMLGVVAFFVNARFRLPIVPVLMIFAAYAAMYLWQSVKTRHPARWKTVALLLVCFVVIDVDFIGFQENKTHKDSISHFTLGNAYLKMNQPDKAIEEYELALATYRKHPIDGYMVIARNVDFNLGRLYWGKGQCERAVPFLERVGGDDRYTLLAKESLADCYGKLDRNLDAARVYHEILRAVPNHPSARQGYVDAIVAQARVYKAAGDATRALELLTGARSTLPGDPRILREIETLRANP